MSKAAASNNLSTLALKGGGELDSMEAMQKRFNQTFNIQEILSGFNPGKEMFHSCRQFENLQVEAAKNSALVPQVNWMERKVAISNLLHCRLQFLSRLS